MDKNLKGMEELDAGKSGPGNSFVDKVGVKADRLLKAKQHPPDSVWFGLGMMGLIGWSVAIPTVGAALFGMWLDTHHPGSHPYTLAFLMAGLVLGSANAWRWVAKEEKAMRREQAGDDE